MRGGRSISMHAPVLCRLAVWWRGRRKRDNTKRMHRSYRSKESSGEGKRRDVRQRNRFEAKANLQPVKITTSSRKHSNVRHSACTCCSYSLTRRKAGEKTGRGCTCGRSKECGDCSGLGPCRSTSPQNQAWFADARDAGQCPRTSARPIPTKETEEVLCTDLTTLVGAEFDLWSCMFGELPVCF